MATPYEPATDTSPLPPNPPNSIPVTSSIPPTTVTYSNASEMFYPRYALAGAQPHLTQTVMSPTQQQQHLPTILTSPPPPNLHLPHGVQVMQHLQPQPNLHQHPSQQSPQISNPTLPNPQSTIPSSVSQQQLQQQSSIDQLSQSQPQQTSQSSQPQIPSHLATTSQIPLPQQPVTPNLYTHVSINSQKHFPISSPQLPPSSNVILPTPAITADYTTAAIGGQPIISMTPVQNIPTTPIIPTSSVPTHFTYSTPVNGVQPFHPNPVPTVIGSPQPPNMTMQGPYSHPFPSPYQTSVIPVSPQNPTYGAGVSTVPMIPQQVLNPGMNTDPRTPRHKLRAAEVKLEISAKGLRDRDFATQSDPTCVIFLEKKKVFEVPVGYPSFGPQSQLNAGGNPDANVSSGLNQNQPELEWEEHDRTECIKDDLNPHFKKQITVPYHFEELQHIRLGIWDIDSKKSELKKHDFLGEVNTTLGELVSSGVWVGNLTSPNERDRRNVFGGIRNLGTIRIIVHENRDGGNYLIKSEITGQNLSRKDVLGRSAAYFIVTQMGESAVSSRSQLYESEVVHRNINPPWKPFQLTVTVPKGGTKADVSLEFAVYHEDSRKRNDEIGIATCTLVHLEQASSLELKRSRNRSNPLRIRNPLRRKNCGLLQINNLRVLEMPSFVDYLQGGLQLHFSVAIDLTKSNGNPSDPMSLHYRENVYSTNRYIRALTGIANVLSSYTPSNNLFAAFGFGAELPNNPGMTNSCFHLGLGPDPHCVGINGILEAYTRALTAVTLSGPTNFAPLIDTVSKLAAQRPNTQTDQNYDVLLILTDGVVSDYKLTVDRIVTASRTVPLSIIIVGIGNSNFKRMQDLDADNTLLISSSGQKAARDICQFVPFRDFENAPPERFGAAVLAEVPGNIVEYYVSCEPPIQPGRKPGVSSVSY